MPFARRPRTRGSANGRTSEARFSSPQGEMNLCFRPYTLELKHAFTIATSSRTTTPVVLVEVEGEDVVGFGEASMPPYLGETHETAAAFLRQVNLEQFGDSFQLEEILPAI